MPSSNESGKGGLIELAEAARDYLWDLKNDKGGTATAHDFTRLQDAVERLGDDTLSLGPTICGVVCSCGPNGEPLACGFEPGHQPSEHSWATLPTFYNGETLIERLAREYVAAGHAWANRVAGTGKPSANYPERERKAEAEAALIEAVEGRA